MTLLMPFLFVVCLWFFSTGGILWLNRLDTSTHPASIFAISVLCGPAVCGILVSAPETGASAAYLGFASSLIIWGWHEASFLMGFVAGPRRDACPPQAKGWMRFRVATAAVIHHEIALALTGLALFAFTWGQPNQIAAHTFALLFVMRLASKLNIFLGVANINTEMMPAHLDYLKSYFKKAPMNALFPFTFAASVGLMVWLYQASDTVSYALLFVLAVLGVLENTLLMLPLRDSKLWSVFTPRTQIFVETRPPVIGVRQEMIR
jgi:putative photosynthetic complex assembly protein 2